MNCNLKFGQHSNAQMDCLGYLTITNLARKINVFELPYVYLNLCYITSVFEALSKFGGVILSYDPLLHHFHISVLRSISLYSMRLTCLVECLMLYTCVMYDIISIARYFREIHA